VWGVKITFHGREWSFQHRSYTKLRQRVRGFFPMGLAPGAPSVGERLDDLLGELGPRIVGLPEAGEVRGNLGAMEVRVSRLTWESYREGQAALDPGHPAYAELRGL